jgi:site-specific DNA-methyltransferase (adenine-specific)
LNIDIYEGDCIEQLKRLADQSINTCITSPPYWGLRNYQEDKQLGMEDTPEEFISNLVDVFREVKRVLRDDGTVWLNLGDTYCGTGHKGNYTDPKHKEGRNGQKIALNNKIDGLKSKDLVGIPWRVALALQQDGWYLRQDIIWHKPNTMPESVKDRCTKAHEYIFLLSKNKKYYYDYEAIKEDAVIGKKRNKRSVWTVPTKPFKGAHFATFPPELIEPCILAGCPEGGVVLDPFGGSGTTAVVANNHYRNAVLIELNRSYIAIMKKRLEEQGSILININDK